MAAKSFTTCAASSETLEAEFSLAWNKLGEECLSKRYPSALLGRLLFLLLVLLCGQILNFQYSYPFFFFFFFFFFLWVITAWSADDWLQLGQWRRVKCDAMCGLWLIVESNWIELKWIESVGTEDLKDWWQMTRLVDWPLKLVQPTGNKMASSNKRATPVRRHFPFQSAIRYQRTNDTRAPPNSIRWQNNPIRVQFHSLLIQFHSIIVDAYLRFYLFRATFHLLFNSINPSHRVSIRHFIRIPLSWVEFNVELQVD